MLQRNWKQKKLSSIINLLHTFEIPGFLTDFQNFSRVFRPTDDFFRVMVDIITRVFSDSGATWADLGTVLIIYDKALLYIDKLFNIHFSCVFHSKECYILFTYTFLAFFCCFSWKNLCFYHFHFSFWQSIEFMQGNINQSETGIGDKKLSVELYVLYPLKTWENLCFSGVSRVYKMGISSRNVLKGFGKARHVGLPH